MKLDKAIETIQDILNAHSSARTADALTAIKLALEALGRHQRRFTLTFNGMMRPLPGETEE